MKDNYNEIEDFISDESFISWVYKTNKKDIKDWELWMANNPSKRKIIDNAAALLSLTQLKERAVSEQKLADAELKLRLAIKDKERPAKIIHLRRKIWYWSAAAILIISLAFGLTFLFHTGAKKIQLATNYGQVKKDKLPDGTEVILNAHSNLVLGKKWEDGSAREVWVDGEAFFHVKKTLHHDKFIVHTNAFDIEVTGTSFNVINEEDKSSVVLKEGSVKIHRSGEAEIIMKPGDFIGFAHNQMEKKKIAKDDYLAWTQNKLVFDNTKLSDVANIIKGHYGVEVKLEGDDIEEKTITGIMPNDNLDVLLEALEATQEFIINRTKNSVTILNRNH